MSAVLGIWHLDGKAVEEKHILKMKDQVSHYGRDQQVIEICDNIGLGCCLNKSGIDSHTDISVYIDEPQGIILVGDAQIYNRTNLICDCNLNDNEAISTQALLLEAYKQWGDDCPRHINGDFAFVIWEKQKKQLFIARDHLGIRPLYYFYNRTTFAFATDYRALLALPFVGRQLDEIKLYALLSNTYHISPERTSFEQIKSLLQAHILKVDEKGIYHTKYWTPGSGEKTEFKTEVEYRQALYEIVNDAVKLRVNYAQVPIGAELSGGLDSSVITVLANRELRKKDSNLILYSWSPPMDLMDKQTDDERERIESLCRQEGLECVFNDPRNPDEQNLHQYAGMEKMIRRELQIMSSRDVRYILSGWGGDQGISHRANLYELLKEGYWRYFLKQIWYQAKGSPLRYTKLLISNTVMKYFRIYKTFGRFNKQKPDILKQEFHNKIKKSCPNDILYFNVNPVIHIESGNIQTRTDFIARLGAVYNVQFLFPFLDYRVVDFAMSIPRFLYYKQGKNRYIYRKAFEDVLPLKVNQCATKQDMAAAAFNRKLAAEISEEKRISPDMINWNIFSAYLDRNKLQKATNIADFKDNLKNNRTIRKKMMICFDIQQVLEEMEKNF